MSARGRKWVDKDLVVLTLHFEKEDGDRLLKVAGLHPEKWALDLIQEAMWAPGSSRVETKGCTCAFCEAMRKALS